MVAAASGRFVGLGHFGLLDLGNGVQKFSCHYEADLDRSGLGLRLRLRQGRGLDVHRKTAVIAGREFRCSRVREQHRTLLHVRQQLERWLAALWEAANEHVSPPVTETALRRYFARDKQFWLAMQRLLPTSRLIISIATNTTCRIMLIQNF